MRESKVLEFKESISNTFLKTVSAYANYGTGKIKFGITDDGKEVGIDHPIQACLDIENRINDSIDPIPKYTLNINDKTSVITLTVFEGLHKPYLYKAKAYKRNNTATIAADRLEFSRLILEGQNLSFEETPARSQALTFQYLKIALEKALHLDSFSQDTLKTLELCTEESGFNIAGELLSDTNSFPGIDMIRFGDTISIILDRETHEHISILEQYDRVLSMYRKYYQYEQIIHSQRETISLIPENVVREAIANALVHRTWDVNVNIHVSMYPDRIEIISPGGLPNGMNEAEFLRGGISVLRNRIIGNVFFRLHLIERFGTGIIRINETYRQSRIKPIFEASENTIRIVLPVIGTQNNLTEDENAVYTSVIGRSLSSSSIVEMTGLRKTKTIAILKKLVDEGYIRCYGNGRGTRYSAE